MPLALKDQNKLPLLVIALANLGLLVLVIHGDALAMSSWKNATKSIQDSLPAGFGLIFIGVANSLLSPVFKARLISTRWQNPLPGSQAFTKWAHGDDRVDLQALARVYGMLPTEPKEQNVLWYKLYKSVEKEVSVNHIHREFLFTRDYGCLAVMMLIVFGCIAFAESGSIKTAWVYDAILLGQAVLVILAARQNGRRMVTTVLAVASEKASESKP